MYTERGRGSSLGYIINISRGVVLGFVFLFHALCGTDFRTTSRAICTLHHMNQVKQKRPTNPSSGAFLSLSLIASVVCVCSLPGVSKLEDTLRALLAKHMADMAAAEATSRKLTQVAALLQDQGKVQFERLAPSHGPALSFSDSKNKDHR